MFVMSNEDVLGRYRGLCRNYPGPAEQACRESIILGPNVMPACCILGQKGCLRWQGAEDDEQLAKMAAELIGFSTDAQTAINEKTCPGCGAVLSTRQIATAGPHKGHGPLQCFNCGWAIKV